MLQANISGIKRTEAVYTRFEIRLVIDYEFALVYMHVCVCVYDEQFDKRHYNVVNFVCVYVCVYAKSSGLSLLQRREFLCVCVVTPLFSASNKIFTLSFLISTI